MSSTSAVFVGDASLLVRCVQAWRDAGHAARLVASHDTAIGRWCEEACVPFHPLESGRPVELPAADCDYLFSVANLEVLPAALIARPRKLAINFHDGPLPRYAGLNATSWALMARETTHAVTWHEMTERVDAGRIVKQASFAVGPDETALGLNARCYEAGIAAFAEIARDAARGDLTLSAQVGERIWFGRDRRPALLATLDFEMPARDLAALVRALDFGNYANPLARPKVYVGDRVLLVRRAQVLASDHSSPAGTVLVSRQCHPGLDPGSLALDATHDSRQPATPALAGVTTLTVATVDGAVVLSGITEADGTAATLPAVGTQLPSIDEATRTAFEHSLISIARGERHWTRTLAQLAPVELPQPRVRDAKEHGTIMAVVDGPVRGAAMAAGFLAWLSAITGHERVSVLFKDGALTDRASELHPWLSAWVPLTLASSPASRPRELVGLAEGAIASLRDAGPCPVDLPLRLADKHPPMAQVARVAINFDNNTMPAGCELTLGMERGLPVLMTSASVFAQHTLDAMAGQLGAWLCAFAATDAPLAQLPLVPGAERESLARWNDTAATIDENATVHGLFHAQALQAPDRVALQWHDRTLSYEALDLASDALAQKLVARGVGPGQIVGLKIERTPELVIALLGVLKTGAAYLPLDPDYPAERIEFMVKDSGTALVLTREDVVDEPAKQVREPWIPASAGMTGGSAEMTAESPAYVIYTSGSTGQPKGVVVTHRNVVNFFAGMDPRIAHEPAGRWLAVTSLSFDISVLELCWTLARGFTVVLHSNVAPQAQRAPGFSLFYFASDHASSAQDRYRLLMEGAKFADRNGFEAVWTPERHFHAFGGLYPNPAVTSAAIAAATERIQIRAGSCVLPLHHPIRVAEEWAFVDNISQGRVGISFASGWQPNDFVIAPEAFADRKDAMLRNIDVVKRLWRGEKLPFPGPNGKPVEVQTLPRPIQKELPVWVTAAGNPETFRQAGELGCNLLTHLLGQTVEDVAEKLRVYRMAWHKAGHAGEGHVTLMLHTFIGDDDATVRETVRQPMKDYLRSSVDLIRQAAWSFPTFVRRAAADGKNPVEVMEAAPLTDVEMDALLEHAFNRYYGASALFGTRERCLGMVQKLQAAGVDEIACLVDFGIDTSTVLAHLEDLKSLMDAARGMQPADHRASVAEDIVRHNVTHLQCTPSMASMLVADGAGREALSQLQALMVGGEALPVKLAKELRALVPGQLIDMYGPTETTIWSTTSELKEIGEFVPLGQPIANTQLRVRTPWGMDCPSLVPGELLIGGAGVAQGYLHRAELTAERFIEVDGQRFYRTGDLVRRHANGAIEFLGRIDHQVKIRGHRIELGEIEATLLRQDDVKEAVVIARDDATGEKRLLAYVTAAPGQRPDPVELRKSIAKALPDVMVPWCVLVLPSFPMTPNGKVDRRALPEAQAIAVRAAGTTPESELEKTIAGIWQEVLGLPHVGTTDNFFDLGGHSLLVVQVQRRLREASGQEVSITDMFRLPTVKALAAHLGGAAPATSAVGDGLARAQARRMMRSRVSGAASTPAPVA